MKMNGTVVPLAPLGGERVVRAKRDWVRGRIFLPNPCWAFIGWVNEEKYGSHG